MTNRFIRLFHHLENGTAYVALLLLALLPFLETIARQIFHSGIRNSTVYLQHLVLVATFIAGSITAREDKHLSLSFKIPFPHPWDQIVKGLVASLSSLICWAFAWSSLSFSLNGFGADQKIGFLPLRLISLVMFAGYAMMALRFHSRLVQKKSRWGMALAGFLAGSFIAFDAISQVAQFLLTRTPAWIQTIQQVSLGSLAHIATPLIFMLVAAAFLGSPIFVVLGGIGFLLFARQGLPLEVIPNQAYTQLTGFAMPAIPLFTIAGFILSESKAGERLVRLFQALFSWFPGGTAVVAIMVCTFFTTFTGASGVTILALGGLLSFVMLNSGYGKPFSLGLLTASGSIGLLFPPSLPVIIYGVTAQISIKEMFKGGVLPGIFLVLAMTGAGIIYSLKRKIPRQSFRFKEALVSLKEAFWEILIPVIVIVGFFGGFTNLVESGAIAIIYALVVEVVIKRDLKIRDLPRVLFKGIPIIGGVLTILALASGLSYYIIDAEIPVKLAHWVQATIHSKYVFLLLLNLALLVVGCFMDIFSAILVVVPLIIPLGNLFHIHPIHLGIIFLANMELGYLTPPVGLNLYLASYRFEEPIHRVYRDVFLFLMIQLFAVLMITYLPFLSTAFVK